MLITTVKLNSHIAVAFRSRFFGRFKNAAKKMQSERNITAVCESRAKKQPAEYSSGGD